jgi:sugar-phosphatase
MDGVLIDTEPIWRAAETAVLAGIGIELTEADLLGTTGVEIGEAVAQWRARSGEPRRSAQRELPRDEEVIRQIIDQVVAHVMVSGQPMAGVPDAIALFERRGLALAIASSSPPRLIDAVCERLGLDTIGVRCSAVDEAKGKPAPDVYLAAARELGVAPEHCLAIEDTVTGITAAKSAGMRCIAIPDRLLAADPRYHEADLVLPSLELLDEPALRGLGVRPVGRPA